MLRDDLLTCPRCPDGLLRSPAPGDVHCASCGAAFACAGDVVDLLPDAPPGWSFAQAAMEFAPLVEIYESRLWRRNPLFGAFLGIDFDDELALIGAAVPGAGSAATVLDVACGPGIYTRPFARAAADGTVIGLDLSLPMLRMAARRTQAEGLQNVVLVRASALRLPLPDARVDHVNCAGALHLFPAPATAVAEMGRVLRPGGVVTLATLRRDGKEASPWLHTLQERFLGLRAFAPEDLAATLDAGGFAPPTVLHAGPRWQVLSARRERAPARVHDPGPGPAGGPPR